MFRDGGTQNIILAVDGFPIANLAHSRRCLVDPGAPRLMASGFGNMNGKPLPTLWVKGLATDVSGIIADPSRSRQGDSMQTPVDNFIG
jgi:hypothetical protein